MLFFFFFVFVKRIIISAMPFYGQSDIHDKKYSPQKKEMLFL